MLNNLFFILFYVESQHYNQKQVFMKICIVKLSAMGDIIHAMVALQFIKNEYPSARIDWVVESAFVDLLKNNPHIDTILPINLKSIKKKKSEIFTQYKILKDYSKNAYDIVIDAQGLLKSAIVAKIIGAKVIAGFDKESIREGIASFFYNKKVHIAYDANAIERNIAVLCEPLGIKIDKEAILHKEPFLFSSKNGIAADKESIVYVVGASKPNKIYPKEKFLEVIEGLKKNALIVWGNNEEHESALWLEKMSDFVQVAEKGNLDDLKNIILNAPLVIGGDTGPTHMAWGCNRASVTIFGNTPGYRNTYQTDINKIVESPTIVNPSKLDKEDFSIRDIESSKIIEIAKELYEQQTKISSL